MSKNITLEDNGISVTIEVNSEISISKLSQIAAKTMEEVLECSGKKYTAIVEDDKPESNITSIVKPQKKESERPPFRDRLPNVLDPNELNITKAETKKTLMRCPVCGQAHFGILKDGNKLFLMKRAKGGDQFDTIMQCDGGQSEFLMTVCKKKDETPYDYYKTMIECDAIDEADFVADSNTEVFCPICNQSSHLAAWMEAYNNPEKYFEYAYVCDICGGELTASVDTDGKPVLKCESCGNEQDMPN